MTIGTATKRINERSQLSLSGRCMLSDSSEHDCRTINISAGGVALKAPVVAKVGERVIAYLDVVGRIEGTVTRLIHGGFAMTIIASERKRAALSQFVTSIEHSGTDSFDASLLDQNRDMKA